MKTKQMYFLISALLFLVFILTIIVFLNGVEKQYGKGLCVDGDGDINLEGFMCEKETSTFYGYSGDSFEATLSIYLFAVLFLTSFFGSLTCLLKGLMGEE